jgi:hypothetical protein
LIPATEERRQKEENTMLKSIDDIKNYDDLFDSLYENLKKLAVERRQFETDIYLYFDDETGKAELYLFENVGGNSWLNDEHITIYTDGPHYESIFDEYNDIEDYAYILNKSAEELTEEAAIYNDCSPEDVETYEVEELIKGTASYFEKVENEYDSCVDDIYLLRDQTIGILNTLKKQLEYKNSGWY